MYCAVPRANHLIRAISPDLVAEYARAHDDGIWATFLDIIGYPLRPARPASPSAAASDLALDRNMADSLSPPEEDLVQVSLDSDVSDLNRRYQHSVGTVGEHGQALSSDLVGRREPEVGAEQAGQRWCQSRCEIRSRFQQSINSSIQF